MKELQESDWITKLLDKVSLTVVGIAAEDEGLKVTYKDVDQPYTLGVKLKFND